MRGPAVVWPRIQLYDYEHSQEAFKTDCEARFGDTLLDAIRNAFQKTPFVYGTTAELYDEAWKRKIERAIAKGKSEAHIRDLYYPGVRYDILKKVKDSTMMDTFCGSGQPENKTHLKRNDEIGKFVHTMMGFEGTYEKGVSGHIAYKRTFKTKEAPWSMPRDLDGAKDGLYGYKHHDSGRVNMLTCTQEMSRIIRAAVKWFGGRMIYEGRNVSYYDVFTDPNTANDVSRSDTALEAKNLFTHFTPGKQSVRFGVGTLDFFWGTEPVIPTKLRFLTNWHYSRLRNITSAVTETTLNEEGNVVEVKVRGQGSNYTMAHSTFNKVVGEDSVKGLLPIWNNFAICDPDFKDLNDFVRLYVGVLSNLLVAP
jgi:hypothetical protein